MTDPRERDPNFPERPTHEDFVMLAQEVIRLDQDSEIASIPTLMGLDEDSTFYYINQRISILVNKIPKGTDPRAILMAMYAEGLCMGQRIERTRHERVV